VEEKFGVLMYAVRGSVVLKYSGQLALLLAVLTLAPLGFALMYAEWSSAQRYAVVCSVLFVVGGWASRLPVPARIQRNEALTITALAFVLSPLIMSWPMMAAGISFTDASFEAVSGITTTGLTALASVEGHPDSFLFARAWMQWYGGLGIVVLSVALLMGHHAAARRLTAPVESGETLVVTARTHARHSFFVYLVLTLAGWAVLWPLSPNGFTALLHVLAAVSTGGFSSFDDSLAAPGAAAAVATMVFCSLGAVSLPLYWRAAHSGWPGGLRILWSDLELRALLIGCLSAGTLLTWFTWLNGGESPWFHGLLMGVSAQTTAGFSTLPVEQMDAASKLVMIVSMLVGGSVGSSAGGFKLLRLLILLRLLQLTLRRSATSPHAVVPPSLGGQKLEGDDALRALQLILLFAGIVVLSWLPFVAAGYDPLNALFEVVSATGTVGLSTGITRPELEPGLKALLCLDMLAGRLEVIALLVMLYPRNWIGRREKAS